jgi:hypothetical protein
VLRVVPAGGHGPRGLAILSLAVVALAGCTRGNEPTSEPEPTPATVTPSLDAIDVSQQFPVTPQDYAEVTVAAWAAPDLIRLAELTTPAVHDQIIELPGPPNLRWTFIRCEDGTGSSDCSFYNTDGDQLVLTVDHELLGGPGATIATGFEVTSYPDEAMAYLEAFVAAWHAGNLARMHNLAVAAAVEAFVELAPRVEPAAAEYEVGETNDGLVDVAVTVAGQLVTTQISDALLGEQHAIRTAALDAG